MKTEITFYGGLNTIGGVVMSVVYGKQRVLLEIGTAYNPATDMFDGTVQHRKENLMYDELKLHRAPWVDGLYAKEHIKDFPLLSNEDSDLHTSIFITHMHLDHMSCMGLVADGVDVYLSEPAQRIEAALETVNQGVLTCRTVGYKVLDPNTEYHVGDITVKPFLLNSKSYQDYSFYVKTPDMKIHYTGDLFLHGDYVDAVWAEMNYVKNEHPDVLVCECTTLMDGTMKMMYDSPDAEIIGKAELPEGMMNKEMVDEHLCKNLSEKDGLCVFNFYEREMSDVMAFNKMAAKTGRIVAYEPETAYIIWKFFNEPVNVYVPDFKYDQDWFKELMAHNPVITLKDIHENPKGYLIQNTYAHIMELFDLPNQDACYLHSGGIPIGAYDPAYANMQRILEMAGFTHINFFMNNYFSHAYPPQVKYYCDEIDAKVLIPTHGNNPERLLAKEGRQRLLPKLGVTYVMEDDKLVEVTK
ncbi:MAG: hypothetical protein IJ356_10295 [Erysipelotrichaceae bacterium]|nr:hypothetical protein [Erysipelotrichaceae bacterium]